MTTQFNDIILAFIAHKAGETFSKAHNVEGNKFFGAFNVADAIGYERDSLEWNCAVSGAMFHINSLPAVIVSNDGILTA